MGPMSVHGKGSTIKSLSRHLGRCRSRLNLRKSMPTMPAKFRGHEIHMSAARDAALNAPRRQSKRRQALRDRIPAHLRRGHSHGSRWDQAEHSAETLRDSSNDPTTEDDSRNRHHSDEEEPTYKNIRHRRLHYGCGKLPAEQVPWAFTHHCIIPARATESAFLHKICNTDLLRPGTRRIYCSGAPPGPIARRSACRTDRFLRHPAGIFDKRFYPHR